MKAYQHLPAGYRKVLRIDLQKDRKTALKVNLGAAATAVILIAAGCFIVPVKELLSIEPAGAYFVRFGALLAGSVAYIVLHELTHAVFMKASGGGKVRFGFTGIYAFAGSTGDYFEKRAYRVIALMPLLFWGAVFAVLTAVVPRTWFWVVWLWQVSNISGAAGDIYVTAKLWKMPDTILVKDTGTDMTVYDRIAADASGR